MKIIVEGLGENFAELKQNITVGSNDITVRAFRPWLYKHLAPAGEVYMYVYDSTGATLIATSEVLTITSISASNYFHGPVRFYCNVVLKKNTTYEIRVGVSNYSFSNSAYIGWCLDWDLQIVDRDYTTSDSNDLKSAFLFETWSHKKIEKGIFV